MTSLMSLAAASLFALFTIVALQLILAKHRRSSLRALQLRPNCLLTRYPIVFVSGRRSLFYFMNYWNRVPDFLAEHGYEVVTLDLPWRNPGTRLLALRRYVERLERPCHLVGDSSLEEELRQVTAWRLPMMKSATLVESDNTVNGRSAIRPQDLQPRRDGLERLHLSNMTAGSSLIGSVDAWLLALHNLFGTSRAIHPREVGVPKAKDVWDAETPFLDFAISLAERDTQ